MGTGVARIFSGGGFSSPKKLTPFLVVALRTEAKTSTKLTTPTVQIYLQFPKKWIFALPGDAHSTRGCNYNILSPVNLAQQFFSALGGGGHVHPVHPLATPMCMGASVDVSN